ncbi:MAG: ABC transporter permease [Erysipelothrix sp.]
MNTLKLAMRNVKKSYKEFAVYFVTLLFSVALFYVFGSVDSQISLLSTSIDNQRTVTDVMMVMQVLSYFVIFIFAFLIIYANKFLIKRRKKEFGTYLLLGMSHFKISWVVITETALIGMLSLIFGLMLGIVISQFASVFAAYILNTSITFEFIFSMKSLRNTIVCYAVVFALVSVFNLRTLRKYSISDLLIAHRKSDVLRKSILWLLLVLSVGVLLVYVAYRWAMVPFHLLVAFPLIFFIGSVGTFFIFYGVAHLFIVVIQKFKKYYYRELNVFILRQFSSKIITSYKMMATVCLLMLTSLAAFIVGFNLNKVLEQQAEISGYYDISLELSETYYEELENKYSQSIRSLDYYHTYESDVSQQDLFTTSEGVIVDRNIAMMRLSDYNRITSERNIQPIHLDKSEVYLHHSDVEMGAQVKNLKVNSGAEISILGNNLKLATDLAGNEFKLSNGGIDELIFIVDDVVMDEWSSDGLLAFRREVINVNIEGDVDAIQLKNDFIVDNSETEFSFVTTRQEVLETSWQMRLFITYVCVYLGVVFLICAMVLIALQVMSEVNDSLDQYRILADMGVSDDQISSILRKHVAIYFLLPLMVALIHATVGVTAVNMNLAILNLAPREMNTAAITLVLFLFIYFVYYTLTMFNAMRILKQR